MSSVKFIDLNIALLPDQKTSQKLIEWSQKLSSKLETDYTLDQNHLPHLSLYSARYPLKNQNTIESTIDNICSHTHPFSISLNSFSFFSGFFFYDVQKNQELILLHEKIVDQLNPLREGLISDKQRQLTALSTEQKEAIEKYGYVSVKKLYMPHISLTHLKNSSQENLAKNLIPEDTNQFIADTLVVAMYGDFGTLPQVLKTYLIK